jgi:hypothetical protein
VVQRNARELKSYCITDHNSSAKLCILVLILDQNTNPEINQTAEPSLQQSLHLYLAQIRFISRFIFWSEIGTSIQSFALELWSVIQQDFNSHAFLCTTENIYLQILILYNYLHPITDRKMEVKSVQESDMNQTFVQNDLCLR